MSENKMKQVAQLFGKQLGEPFHVSHPHYKYKCFMVFISYGLVYWDDEAGDWYDTAAGVMKDLLTGKAVILD